MLLQFPLPWCRHNIPIGFLRMVFVSVLLLQLVLNSRCDRSYIFLPTISPDATRVFANDRWLRVCESPPNLPLKTASCVFLAKIVANLFLKQTCFVPNVSWPWFTLVFDCSQKDIRGLMYFVFFIDDYSRTVKITRSKKNSQFVTLSKTDLQWLSAKWNRSFECSDQKTKEYTFKEMESFWLNPDMYTRKLFHTTLSRMELLNS